MIYPLTKPYKESYTGCNKEIAAELKAGNAVWCLLTDCEGFSDICHEGWVINRSRGLYTEEDGTPWAFAKPVRPKNT
jgi:hypothetical protein